MKSPAYVSSVLPALIPLAWSPLLCLAIVLSHCFLLASVCAEGVPVWVRGLVASLCLVSAVRACFVFKRLRSLSLRPHAEGAQLITKLGALEGRMLPSSVEMGPIIVLHWKAEVSGKIERFALLRDAFARDKWRVLKVWLRWSVLKQAA